MQSAKRARSEATSLIILCVALNCLFGNCNLVSHMYSERGRGRGAEAEGQGKEQYQSGPTKNATYLFVLLSVCIFGIKLRMRVRRSSGREGWGVRGKGLRAKRAPSRLSATFKSANALPEDKQTCQTTNAKDIQPGRVLSPSPHSLNSRRLMRWHLLVLLLVLLRLLRNQENPPRISSLPTSSMFLVKVTREGSTAKRTKNTSKKRKNQMTQ